MPNLGPARARVQKLMLDNCVITSDPLRLSDAVMDETTLQLTPSSDDQQEIYSGSCFIAKKSGNGRSTSVESGDMQSIAQYQISIPWGSDNLQKGYVVTVSSTQDPALDGKVFTIVEIESGTLQVWRSATMELLESDRDV